MKNKNKISICHLSVLHRRDDIRIFNKECCTLAEYGFKTTYIVADGKGNNQLKNVQIIDLGGHSNTIYRLLFTHSYCLLIALVQKAKVYHFHDPELMIVGLILKLFGKKVIMDVHEDVPRQIIKSSGKNIRISRLIESLEEFSSTIFNHIIVVSPYLKKRFLKYTPKVTTICNFPDLREFDQPTITSYPNNKIVYVGGLTRKRGLTYMLDIIENTNLELHLAGTINSSSRLYLEVKQHPAWRQVVYHGYLDRPQLVELLKQSAVGLSLLNKTPNYNYTYLIKVFEYMAVGIPVLISSLEAMGKIVSSNEAGIVVSHKNIPLVRKVLSDLIEDPSRRNLLGYNGRKAIENKYNWASEGNKLIDVYESILN